jgi:hypothetical protein
MIDKAISSLDGRNDTLEEDVDFSGFLGLAPK